MTGGGQNATAGAALACLLERSRSTLSEPEFEELSALA
jgi:hypothetical protein